jgi:hypothetical protein
MADMAGKQQLKVIPKHKSDAKLAAKVDEEVAGVQKRTKRVKPNDGIYKGDPLRRTATEVWKDGLNHGVMKNMGDLKGAWANEQWNKEYEEALSDAKQKSVVAAAGVGFVGSSKPIDTRSDHDSPFFPQSWNTKWDAWEAEDTKELSAMSIERLLGINLWLHRVLFRKLFHIHHRAKKERLFQILSTRDLKETIVKYGIVMPAEAKETDAGYSIAVLNQLVNKYLIKPSMTDYKGVDQQKQWAIALANAMDRLQKEFQMNLPPIDRLTIIDDTGIKGSISVPNAVTKICQMFETKQVAKKSTANQRMACVGLLIQLWHSELVKCFPDRPPLVDDM